MVIFPMTLENVDNGSCFQFQLIRLEHLCLQFLQNFIKMENVLIALQSAAALKLDYIKVPRQCLVT